MVQRYHINEMSQLNRRLLDPVSFFLQWRAYGKSCRVDPTQTSHRQILDELTSAGICVLEGYLDRDTVNRVWDEISDPLMKLRDGQEIPGLQGSRYPEYGNYVLHHAESHSKSVLPFMKDPMIQSIANAFAGGSGVSFDLRAELRSEARENRLVDFWHADTWKFRFKAMLYLTDVTEENAPFRYLAGSHRSEPWPFRRFCLDYVSHAFQGQDFKERYCFREGERQRRDPLFREMICTAPAGTLILFDGRGLHSGTPLRKPPRMILNHTFVRQVDLL